MKDSRNKNTYKEKGTKEESSSAVLCLEKFIFINMSKAFCQFDKDQKTFEHAKLYYDAIEKNIDFISIDNLIQKRELENHLNRCQKIKDQQEILSWIENNAENFRSYLNSLKVLALFLYIDDKRTYRKEPVFEVFCDFVDNWDKLSPKLIDTIRVEKVNKAA